MYIFRLDIQKKLTEREGERERERERERCVCRVEDKTLPPQPPPQ